MLNLNLFYMAVLVLGLNIWTTNDNALYTAGLGLSNIFGFPKKTMVFVSGAIGTVASIWLYWNFCNWLNILNATLPPVGIILILHYFLNKGKEVEQKVVDWSAIVGVVAGAIVANLVNWGFASINGIRHGRGRPLLGHRPVHPEEKLIFQDLFQEGSGDRRRVHCQVFRCAFGHDAPAFAAPFRAHVKEVVHALEHVQVVLDDDDGVAGIH